jgi:hypothetical protein
MKRIYIPKVGEKVKLRLPEHYFELDAGAQEFRARQQKIYDECRASLQRGLITEAQHDEVRKKASDEVHAEYAEYRRTHDVPDLWAWFEVLEIKQTSLLQRPEERPDYWIRLKHVCRAVNAPEPAWVGEVRSDWIEPPLGWKPTYEMLCKDRKQADKVVSDWFKRGIVVWSNHDLGSSGCGGSAFTPADLGTDSVASPHWRFTGVPTEVIAAEDCPKVFTIKVYEEWEPSLPEGRKARDEEIRRLRESGVEVQYHKRHKMWLASRETLVYQPGA